MALTSVILAKNREQEPGSESLQCSSTAAIHGIAQRTGTERLGVCKPAKASREGTVGSREERTLGYWRNRSRGRRRGNIIRKEIPYSPWNSFKGAELGTNVAFWGKSRFSGRHL